MSRRARRPKNNQGIQRRDSPVSASEPNNPQPNSRVIATKTEAHYYSSPIAPPQIVAAWEQILPGSADRILKLTEKQSTHRQKSETKVIDSNISKEKIGQILAFVFCISVVLCGTFLIYSGKDTAGLVAICAAIVAPAGLFIYSKQQGRKELDKKKDEATKALQAQQN
jgi:uncharacterized membrane protein